MQPNIPVFLDEECIALKFHVTEIERKARREKIDKPIRKLKVDRALGVINKTSRLNSGFFEGFKVFECFPCSHTNC